MDRTALLWTLQSETNSSSWEDIWRYRQPNRWLALSPGDSRFLWKKGSGKWCQCVCFKWFVYQATRIMKAMKCRLVGAMLSSLFATCIFLPEASMRNHTHKHPYFERSAVYISRLLNVSAHGRWSMCQRWCVNHGSSTGRWPQNVVIMCFKNNGPCLSWPWQMSCSHQLEDENRFLKVMRCLSWVLVSCGHL